MAQGSTNYTHLTKVSFDTALAYGKDEAETNIFDSSANCVLPGKLQVSTQTITSNGSITALDSSKSLVYMNPTTTATIKGIAAGSDGQYMTIFNLSSNNITLSNQDSGASAANRLILSTSTSTTLKANGSCDVFYCSGSSRWLVARAQS